MPRIFLIAFLLSGCAHRWFYLPEIKGVGETRGGKGDIVYRIPSEGGLTLALRALGIKKKGEIAMLGMRMSFANGAHVSASLFVREQVLLLGDTPIQPKLARTGKEKTAKVSLAPEHVVVELLYELPRGSGGGDGIESYRFRWKIRYGQKAEEQVARFDRNDAAPQQAGSLFPDDPFYPYDRAWMMLPSWEMNDPLWWEPIP